MKILKYWKSFFHTYKTIILLFVIITSSLYFRVISLETIPSTISGDEVTYLSDVYKILFGWKGISPVSFMSDGSVAGLYFYWVSLWVKFFGINHALFGLRFSVVILSILSLIPFYLLLKKHTSDFIATLFTFLLSTNYVFLNFSRTAWPNMWVICWGLWTIFLLEKAWQEKKYLWYGLAGFFSGITLYGYNYGRLFVIGIALFLGIHFLQKKERTFRSFLGIILYIFITLLIITPFLIACFQDNFESISRRSNATYVFSPQNILTFDNFLLIVNHQLEYSIRGLVFFDPHVMSEGYENKRYTPLFTAPINIFVQFLFIVSFLYLLIKKRSFSLWWSVYLSSFTIVFLTDAPPNFARGLFLIPLIYFFCGICLFDLLKLMHIYSSKKLLILCCCIIIGIWDCKTYFSWMQSEQLYTARQPSIDYKEFSEWQTYQINRVILGLNPVTNYEWYEIRKTVIPH